MRKAVSLILALVMVTLMIPLAAFVMSAENGDTGADNKLQYPVELDETRYSPVYSIDFTKINNREELDEAGWVLMKNTSTIQPDIDLNGTNEVKALEYSEEGLYYKTSSTVNFTCGAVAFNSTDNYVIDYTLAYADTVRIFQMHFKVTNLAEYKTAGEVSSNGDRWMFRGDKSSMKWDNSTFRADATYSGTSLGDNLKGVDADAYTAVEVNHEDVRIRIFVTGGESKYAVMNVGEKEFYILDAPNEVVDGSYFSFSACDNYANGANRRVLMKDFSIYTYETPDPIAPTEIKYELKDAKNGHADGKVTVKLAENHNTKKLAFYWGDANGKLAGYDAWIGTALVSSADTREVIYNMPHGLIIPPEATKLMVYPHGMRGETDVPLTFPLPNGSNYVMPNGEPVSEFWVMSDTHWGRNELCEAQTMTALNYIAEHTPNADGIFVVGDVINGGDLLNGGGTEKAQYEGFYEAWHSISNLPAIYPATGNHEYFGWYQGGQCDEQGYINAFVDNLRDYYEHIGIDEDWNKPYYDVTVGGSYFIVLGVTSVVDSNGGYLGDEQIEWLDAKLAAASSDKPVFIMLHQPIAGTVAENINTGEDQMDIRDSGKVKTVLNKYPNAVVFNGHTHYSFLDENYKNMAGGGDKYVAFNDSSIRDNLSGYYVLVYNDRTIVRGIDFETGEWMASAQFVVNEREVADKGGDTTPPANSGTSSTTAPEATDAPDITDETTAEPKEEKKGCGSSLSGIGVALTALVGVATVTVKKRREDK